MKKIIGITAITITLTGCFDEKPKEETHSVEWYQKNKVEMNNTLKRCRDNPGELKNTPNCMNAKQAKHLALFGTSDDLHF